MLRVTFGGCKCIGDVSFSLRQGVMPSTGSISFPANVRPPEQGDLSITSENGNLLIRDLHLINPVYTQSSGGDIMQATIADKRIEWRYGYLMGQYNQPDEETGRPSEEKKLDELFDLAFEPYDIRSYFCIVVIAPVNLPRVKYNRPVLSKEYQQITTPYPASIIIVGNQIVNQRDYSLVPVGVEWSGHGSQAGFLKAIDALSYTPTAGWGKSILRDFTDVTAGERRQLALKTIFKWYGYLGGTGRNARAFCLPWIGHITEMSELDNDSIDGTPKRSSPYIKTNEIETDDITVCNGSTRIYEGGYKLDYVRGIVRFDKEVVKIVAAGDQLKKAECQAATVTITAAHNCPPISQSSGVWGHYYYVKTLPGGTLPPLIHRDSSLTLYATNDTADSTQKNALDAHCEKIADQLAKRFDYQQPAQRVYPEILDVSPDGDLKSVTWNISPDSGYNTVLSWGREEVRPLLPSYEERTNQKRTYTLQWPTERIIESEQKHRQAIEQAGG